eukprot:14998118-Alexandrium_andersonii.AAC.1
MHAREHTRSLPPPRDAATAQRSWNRVGPLSSVDMLRGHVAAGESEHASPSGGSSVGQQLIISWSSVVQCC